MLVTDTVRSLTRARLSVRFVARGSPSLKGIEEPITLFAVAPAAVPASEAAQPSAPGGRQAQRERLLAKPAARWIALGLGVMAIAVIVGTAMLRPSAGSPSNSTPIGAGGASPSAITALPVVADVPFYRADDHRTSNYPGPGPVAEPVVAWQRSFGGGGGSVPIVVDGKVVVGDGAGRVHAFDARTGDELWEFSADAGFTESAAAAGGLVFAADLGGTLHALDASTGIERWHAVIPNNGLQPLVSDGLLYVGSSDGHAYGLDPATGQQRWLWEGPAGVDVGVSVVSDGVAYIGGGGTLHAVRLVDKVEAWHRETGSSNESVAVAAGDTTYISGLPTPANANSSLLAIDRASGAVRWRFSSPSGPQVTPGPVRDGVVYVNTGGDGIYALRDKGTGYEVVWQDPKIPATYRPTSLVGDTLYVGVNEGPLIGLRASDGVELWRTARAAQATTNPVVTGGFVFRVDDEAGVLWAWAEPAIGRDGSLFVLGESGPLYKFDKTGALAWRTVVDADRQSYRFQLHGFALRPDGMIVGFTDGTGLVVTIDPAGGRVIRRWGTQGNEPGQNGLSGEPSVDAAGNIFVFQYVPQELQVFDPAGRLLGGTYETTNETVDQPQFAGRVPWPAPVFDKSGFGRTFGPDGLERIKVTLPQQ